MNRAVWDRLLDEARGLHLNNPELTGFCPFPDDLVATEFPKNQTSAKGHIDNDVLAQCHNSPLVDAFVEAGSVAYWRETYKHAPVERAFLDKFGCYCLIGPNAPFTSNKMFGWFVHMPANLWYPWHHHPAEEMYSVISGEAEFMRRGEENRILREGQSCEHRSNQPHAMKTGSKPVLTWVVWRNHFDVTPVLTSQDQLQ